MKELSLHILDLVQNSLEAGGHCVIVKINEDENGFFVFSVEDDGRGMSEEMVKQVRDPFVTTRLTRKVGLGIPFIDMTTAQSGGELTIESEKGCGTVIRATYLKDHLDRPPLGDIVSTIKVILAGAPELRLMLHYLVGTSEFIFDSQELRGILGPELDFSNPEISAWLGGYLEQEINKVREAGGMR